MILVALSLLQVLDLRFCKLSGANLRGKTLSGALAFNSTWSA